ncbi:Short-chain dehydrogenase/oxidoreductase [Heterostelium album PN500]|uniref:Short-chain dehydrogenase/oxidoreductase n=1 Tax=Heterostelium pallidum (strain ATCC 26659 / Pp 5 / PN500) TaxID=670386 RepID=D3BPX8_HETP5|nr:Short-chain dehydrogenase/oxidoreductase [Heterostelium album PN500]EFA76261.1 Short-chain dehydrogenase/oxidoreductase [Heterostelium album PN500]|eukprot:XP_020428394.1 Short-chain dehydrogenase/oxidoreductase [Heterostelium album PN500]
MTSALLKPLVVVTGASSGFGVEIAKLFSAAGYPLLLVARRLKLMQALNLPNTLCKEVDVTDYKQFESAVREAEAVYGKCDLMINNAGVMLLEKIWDQDIEEWHRMLEVNLKGVMNGHKIVMRDMIDRRHGTVINVSSIAGRKSFGNHAAYCATKFGVHALSETVREEAAPYNVRVMVVAPGAAETELLGHSTNESIVEGYKSWKASTLDQGISLDPVHIASSCKFMYEMPQEVNIRELVLASTKQNA